MLTIIAKTTIELALVLLLIYGFTREKEMIEFEQLLRKAIVIKYRLYKKNRHLAEMRRNREFRVVNGTKSACTAENGTLHVA